MPCAMRISALIVCRACRVPVPQVPSTMRLLYLETNFIVGAAVGHDTEWSRLLAVPKSGARLCVPEMCLLEALAAIRWKGGRVNEFRQLLSDHSREFRRINTPVAAQLATTLQQSELELAKHVLDF